jgi:hypothetical protein
MKDCTHQVVNVSHCADNERFKREETSGDNKVYMRRPFGGDTDKVATESRFGQQGELQSS